MVRVQIRSIPLGSLLPSVFLFRYIMKTFYFVITTTCNRSYRIIIRAADQEEAKSKLSDFWKRYLLIEPVIAHCVIRELFADVTVLDRK